jgi:hypothetical protein
MAFDVVWCGVVVTVQGVTRAAPALHRAATAGRKAQKNCWQSAKISNVSKIKLTSGS